MSLYDINTEATALHDWLRQDVEHIIRLRDMMITLLDMPIDFTSTSDSDDILGYFDTLVRRTDMIVERVERLRTGLSEIYLKTPDIKKCIDKGYVEICPGKQEPEDGDEDNEPHGEWEEPYGEDELYEWEP